MSELILMERGIALMFVPPDKLALYLANGWKEISRGPMSTDTAAPAEKAPKKAIHKKKGPKAELPS